MLLGREDMKISSTMVKVKVFKLCNSKAFWKTRYQNFFKHGGVKGIQTKEFYGFFETQDKKAS